MPVYRNITINLVSQFDILNIPEYAPPAALDDPFSASPALVDNSLVSCYIPIYPLSQFWLSYSISAPHPPKALYYFKLFINDACVVSWGCGEENGFKGKTMYGLYDSGERWMGEPGLDARAFSFANDVTTHRSMNSTLGQVMEVRVYRARGRKRAKPKLEDFQTVIARSRNQSQNLQPKNSRSQPRNIEGGISMLEAGMLPDEHPKRYYTFSLLDPLDLPFATFRWYYRTWAQLEALGVTKPLAARSSSETDEQVSPKPKAAPSKSPFKPPLIPEPGTRDTDSPGSISDDSPLTIRGLSVPAIPLIDLPLPSTPFGSPLKRSISPILTSSSATACSQSRFAQLIRRSSRSPSPPKKSKVPRSPSPPRVRRTSSMGALMGAVQSAMRRSGKGSQEFRKGQDGSVGQSEAE
ncbi:MAG: hypothetical protein L6R41_002307 [Letrouitia leprolyta]|nr:MAG: hypothetical protein L6R41_002307 [Letrouitia leprolyta]